MPRPVLVSLAMGLPGVLAGGPAVPVPPGNDSCAEILAAANVTGRFAVVREEQTWPLGNVAVGYRVCVCVCIPQSGCIERG